ncbi:hypothetical protein [Mesorhizobium loti]|uniref:Uncharacterized protein n=1 Tax=Mesorhizobium loti R88b TaxID=935548 RepID=A0A6M7WW77_RHILI|nr:hypothetical protein [Mesorhizobium loti]QKD06332.1 hypothetical protein EB235_15335 [Mesorhizobium loti R88b]
MAEAEQPDAVPPNPVPDGVEVTENMGEWHVRVVINGNAHLSTFDVESYARSFADSQRIRVGLTRLASRI